MTGVMPLSNRAYLLWVAVPLRGYIYQAVLSCHWLGDSKEIQPVKLKLLWLSARILLLRTWSGITWS